MPPYVSGKGALKFSLKQPLPHDLISQIISAHLKRHLVAVS
jgi:uncharacterized protein YdhG (YjbR/CyaY superfamily)